MESLLVEDDDVMSRQTRIKAENGHKFWSDRWIALQVTVVSRGRFPCITYGIPNRWRGCLMQPDRNNRWKGPYFLIRPLDRAPSFTVVSGGRFPCITYGIPNHGRGCLVEPDRNNRWKGPYFFIRPLDRGPCFTVVSGGRFPCITYGIPNRGRGGLVEPD